MDVPMLADQQELFDISSEQTQDVIWKTLPEVMDGRDGLRERIKEICAISATRWWWWWWSVNSLV